MEIEIENENKNVINENIGQQLSFPDVPMLQYDDRWDDLSGNIAEPKETQNDFDEEIEYPVQRRRIQHSQEEKDRQREVNRMRTRNYRSRISDEKKSEIKEYDRRRKNEIKQQAILPENSYLLNNNLEFNTHLGIYFYFILSILFLIFFNR